MEKKYIQVNKETHERLDDLQRTLAFKRGERMTFDSTIVWFLDFLDSNIEILDNQEPDRVVA